MESPIYWSHQDGISKLASYAIQRNLIPFIGAGFSAGSEAAGGCVPDGAIACQELIQLILESDLTLSQNDILGLSFTNLAELFFDSVPSDKRAAYFEKNFTDVELPSSRRDFINKINWPYLYTINFDDGIERCSKYKAILPYKKFRTPKTSKKLLYKLHGDASFEAKYIDSPDEENIIFSNSQYLKSISSDRNIYILNYLKADLSGKVILFIGCSLNDESDLKYVCAQCQDDFLPDSIRIIVRTEPLSKLEMLRLAPYHISHVLLVDSYEKFYIDLVEKYQELQCSRATNLYSFYNPLTLKIENKVESLSLLSHGNIFDTQNNTFKRGKLHVLRSAVQEAVSNLEEYGCIIIKGRRFSGKTAVLCDISRRNSNRDVFYFPSDTLPDEELISKLFTETQNGLFLFDSNSISPDVYGYLMSSEPLLCEKNHRIVMCINSSDNYAQRRLKTYTIELSNYFEDGELLQNRAAADSLGISRRKKSQTNDDYLYLLSDNNLVDLSFLDIDVSKLNFWGYILLIVLSARDKVYFSDAVILGITNLQIGEFLKVCSPMVEYLCCSPEESTTHAGMKLVHNSKLGLIKALSRCDDQKIIDSIIYIVMRSRSNYSHRRFYIDIILFDTLNQLFSYKSEKQQLVISIYDKLSTELSTNLHYWLQRAKCLYRYESSKEMLSEAYLYAKKVYDDGWSEICCKSALTLSLICCALAEKEGSSASYYKEAVCYAVEAVFSQYYQVNTKLLSYDLSITHSENCIQRIERACNYILKTASETELKAKAQRLLMYLRSLQPKS